MKKLAIAIAAAAVAVAVGVKYATKLRPQLAKVPVVGKLFA